MNINEQVESIIESYPANAEEKTYDFYCAAGWFSPSKRKALDMMVEVLEELGLHGFYPEKDSPQIGKNPTEEERTKNFESNLKAIKSSKMVVASTEGLDSGTIWECGYASALGIPVYGFAPLLPEGVPFNLMLAQSMEEVFLTKEAMLDYFKNGVKPARIGAC